jgi:hypothetical protein
MSATVGRAASPRIMPDGATANGMNNAPTMINRYRKPAILALARGEYSLVRSVIVESRKFQAPGRRAGRRAIMLQTSIDATDSRPMTPHIKSMIAGDIDKAWARDRDDG